jgi:nitrogen-specific signal transduction histidine kinase
MFRAFLARLTNASRGGGRPDHVSIFLPFLIISIGLGALAWRSYYLSTKMEVSAKTLAVQSAGYAAEITARRVDAAVRAEMTRVAEDWQFAERSAGEPTFAALRDWLTQNDWMISAIYVPDIDPASSIYVTELPSRPKVATRFTREFFTASGTIRYAYDADRLLADVIKTTGKQPLVRGAPGLDLQHQAAVRLVRDVPRSMENVDEGFAVVAPLGAPLGSYGIRAHVRTAYVGGKGWENQRVMSLWVSLLALALMAVGAVLAHRGMKKESETMKLRGALIANVSHELRTPLSMIRLGAETLKRGKVNGGERQEIEDQILREVLLLSHLVENVLDVARIQNRSTKALAFTPVHPRDLIRNLITTYESWIRSKGFSVSVQIDETIGEQMWDRDSVSRALLNLIDNAIKYSLDDRRIDVILRRTSEHVVLEVKDRGIGIEGKDAQKIFDPYYRAQFSDTTTRRGAGLGLTLVQQIVESHGGRVEVESTPGAGSTFRLLFPRDLDGAPAVVPSLARAREAF